MLDARFIHCVSLAFSLVFHWSGFQVLSRSITYYIQLLPEHRHKINSDLARTKLIIEK